MLYFQIMSPFFSQEVKPHMWLLLWRHLSTFILPHIAVSYTGNTVTVFSELDTYSLIRLEQCQNICKNPCLQETGEIAFRMLMMLKLSYI